MRILYFAWLREKTGFSEELLTLPEEILTVQELVVWLEARSPGHAAAFANTKMIRCAIDQEFAGMNAVIGQASEIAFFPPVTGG